MSVDVPIRSGESIVDPNEEVGEYVLWKEGHYLRFNVHESVGCSIEDTGRGVDSTWGDKILELL